MVEVLSLILCFMMLFFYMSCVLLSVNISIHKHICNLYITQLEAVFSPPSILFVSFTAPKIAHQREVQTNVSFQHIQ